MNLELVTRIIKDGGPWEDPVLQAVLKAQPASQETGTSRRQHQNIPFLTWPKVLPDTSFVTFLSSNGTVAVDIFTAYYREFVFDPTVMVLKYA